MKRFWKYYDYGFDPYVPVATTSGKLSSDALLSNSLQKSVYQNTLLLFLKKIKHAIGPWRTVWGVKLDRSGLSWELYFYNHRDRDSRRTAPSLLKVFRSCFQIQAFADIDIEHQPYFMVSLDLNDEILKSRQIKGVHLYTRGRKEIFQGNSYFWGPGGMSFENHYDFYRMPKETDPFVDRLKQSVVFGRHVASFLRHELVRQLLPCYRICIANKRSSDGIYFSRVNVDQLIVFLKYFSYPEDVVDFVVSRRKGLNHLLYDVAFDCAVGPCGPVFGKSSYYGVF